MSAESKETPHGFSIEETEDGYAIHIKGDKEKIKAKLEAIEAYHEFRRKAKAAGFTGHGHHGFGPQKDNGFFSLIHKHMMAFHGQHQKCQADAVKEEAVKEESAE